ERAARLEEALLGLSEARGRVVRPIEGVAEEALGVLQQIFRRIFALVDLRHFALPHLGRRVHPTQAPPPGQSCLLAVPRVGWETPWLPKGRHHHGPTRVPEDVGPDGSGARLSRLGHGARSMGSDLNL